ncbi:alkyl hydroperoxide reductase [Thiocystis minor]|nr:alkyl hydroperoxide reductase [Thiocystis minor]
MKPLLRCLFVLLPCWFGAVAGAGEEQALTPVENQAPAPDFNLQGPDGQTYRLADYRGKPIILNFWATWCPPCRAEMPSMQRAHDILASEGIAVIAINVGDDAEAVRQFLSDTPVSFPLPMDSDSTIAQRYPVIGLPTTFVIDAEGRLAFSATGEQEWDDPALLDQVRALQRLH